MSDIRFQPAPLVPLTERIEQMRTRIQEADKLEVYDAVMADVDASRHEAIVERHRGELERYADGAPFHGDSLKYIDIAFWVFAHLRPAFELGLGDGEKRTVFDIGSGGGHFLAIARVLGCRATGLDIEKPEFLGELVEVLGGRRIIWNIMPSVPLPAEVSACDLINVTAVTFDRDPSWRTFWSLADWRFFIEDAIARLQPAGRLRIGLNLGPKPGGCSPDEVMSLAASFGAAIQPIKGLMDFNAP